MAAKPAKAMPAGQRHDIEAPVAGQSHDIEAPVRPYEENEVIDLASSEGHRSKSEGEEHQAQLMHAIDALVLRHRSDLLLFLQQWGGLLQHTTAETGRPMLFTQHHSHEPFVAANSWHSPPLKLRSYLHEKINDEIKEEVRLGRSTDELICQARSPVQIFQTDSDEPDTDLPSPPGCMNSDAPLAFLPVVPDVPDGSNNVKELLVDANGVASTADRPKVSLNVNSARSTSRDSRNGHQSKSTANRNDAAFQSALIKHRNPELGRQPVVEAVGATVKSRMAKMPPRKDKDFILRRSIELARADRNTMQRITRSQYYESLSALILVSNAFFIGVQTQTMGEREKVGDTTAEPPFYLYLSLTFAVLFSADLGLRMSADGMIEFFKYDRAWNVMDVVVVFFTNIDIVLETVFSAENNVTSKVSMLRVLRVVRIVRVVRVVRVLRYFRELRTMILSISHSMKSLVWVLMIIGLMFYMFAVAFTAATVAHLQATDSHNDESTKQLQFFFGTLDVALLSMFMAMSGGDDWGQFYYALEPLGQMYRTVFLFYMAFALFAVVNIVTGVYVHSAMENMNHDVDSLVKEQMHKKEDYLKQLAKVFEEVDTDASGNLSWEEFERCMLDERYRFFLQAMKIETHDARRLFMLLDRDHSGVVNCKEFLAGCYRLQGQASSMDTIMMYYQVEYVAEVLTDLSDGLEAAGVLSRGKEEEDEEPLLITARASLKHSRLCQTAFADAD